MLILTGQPAGADVWELSLPCRGSQRESRLPLRCHASGEPPDHSSASVLPQHFLILEGSSPYQRRVHFFTAGARNNNRTRASANREVSTTGQQGFFFPVCSFFTGQLAKSGRAHVEATPCALHHWNLKSLVGLVFNVDLSQRTAALPQTHLGEAGPLRSQRQISNRNPIESA